MKKVLCFIICLMLLSAGLASATMTILNMKPSSELISSYSLQQKDEYDPLSNDLPSVFFFEDNYDVFIDDDFTFTSNRVSIENAEHIQWFTTNGGGMFDDEKIPHPTYMPSPSIDYPQGYTIIGVAVANEYGNATAFVQLDYIDSEEPPIVIFDQNNYSVLYGDCFTFTAEIVNIQNAASIQWFTTNGGGVFDNENIKYPTYCPSPSVDYPQGYTIIGVAATNAFGSVTKFVWLIYVNETSNPDNNYNYPIGCEVPAVEFSHPFYNVSGDSFYFGPDVVIYDNVENIEILHWFTTTGGGVFDSETILYPTYTPGIIDYMVGYAEIGVVISGCGSYDDAMTTLYLMNQPPVADFSYSPDEPEVGQTVFFTDESIDPDGYIAEWNWDFGDGSSSTEENPTHIYTSAGTYSVSLTVTDNDGASDSISKDIVVSEPYVNNPPLPPSNPYPEDGSTNIDIDVTVSWECSDPDGDPLTYDVYFGTSTPLPKVQENQTDDFYTPGVLTYGTTYYWMIVAWDDKGAFTEGDLWEFTTKQSVADLGCTGSLQWADVKPGDTVTGTFTVMNVGDPQSLLDWEIVYYPCWGTWTFTPESGSGLTPEDGSVTVSVEVVAPNDKQKQFTGKIILVNSNDDSNTCQIDIALATQKTNSFPLLQRILQLFPNLLPLLRTLLGL